MKVVVINGVNHKGSTNYVANKLVEKLKCDEVKEFFLPRDFSKNCLGCWTCYNTSLDNCPHYHDFLPLYEAILKSDVIIFASPVYVYHITGAMKNFLDHFGVKWMVHRPETLMFKKCGVCISTAAGAGMNSANKDIRDSLSFYGIPKIYSIGIAVHASSPTKLEKKTILKIESKTSAIAKKINRIDFTKSRVSLKSRLIFNIIRLLHKKGLVASKADKTYWQDKGWYGKTRPWK